LVEVLHGRNFAAVLQAARTGDDWAWKALYDELAPSLLGYLRARRAAHPEELLGKVMLQIVRDLPSFGGGNWDLRVWAFTIAHNRLRDEEPRGAPKPKEPMALPAFDRLDPLWAPSVERVGRLLALLDPDEQNVILLRILGELTCEEVGKVIGEEADTVDALQLQALETLRSELAKEVAAI
jgi:RNA polymerase sigma factor (sigma-70 family)